MEQEWVECGEWPPNLQPDVDLLSPPPSFVFAFAFYFFDAAPYV